MTLHCHATTATPEPSERFRLPHIPEREPDEATQSTNCTGKDFPTP